MPETTQTNPNPQGAPADPKEKLRLAEQVARHVNIVQVHLFASQTRMGRPPVKGTQKSLRVRHRVRGDTHPEQSLVRILVDLVLEETPSSPSEQPETPAEDRLMIGATFQLVYQVRGLESLEQDGLRAFAEINGVYNVWPYWREFVQSTLGRMGLPAITLPVYRIAS